MGLTTTTTNLSYARNELIKVGESFVFDKVADMIYYTSANNDITTTTSRQILTTDDKTAAFNAFYSYIDTGGATGWTTGNVVAGRFKLNIDGTSSAGDATALWAGLVWAGTVARNGLAVAMNVELTTTATNNAPNAILYIQSLPGTGASHAGLPYIVFTETPTGTGSNILFECGHVPAGTTVTSGGGKLFNTTTLQIKVNGTAKYIPLSTVEATFTTDQPVYVGTDASPITITSADYQLSVHTTVDTASTGWMNPIAFDMESTASAAMSGDVQMIGIQAYARLTTGSAWTSSGGFCGFSSAMQTVGTTTATSGVMSAITAVMQVAAGHTSSLQSKVAGIVVQNQVNSSATMGDHFSGILIMGGAYETLISGIKIEDGATITAINIDACTTGINISDATTAIQVGADASDGGDVLFYGAAANELMKWDSSEATLDVVCKTVGSSDFAFSVYATQASLKSEGIAAMLDATISGTPTGHSFAVGAWLNIAASSTLGGYDFRGLDVGIYDAGAASSTAAKIYGICISTYIGATANPVVHAMMRFNTTQAGGDAPDYWFLAANPVAVAWTTNTAHTDAATAKVGAIKVKITGSTGDPGYIYIYSDAGS